MFRFGLILLFVFTSNFAHENQSPANRINSELAERLEVDIRDGQLHEFSLIEAAFIVSGATTGESLNESLRWYEALIRDIEDKNIMVLMDQKASAERLFFFLHSTWLKTYQKEATTLLDIQQKRNYNCVSATVLYNLTCEKLGLQTMGFETPTHVYTIFTNFGEYVMVENTTSMGFNIIKNLKNYSKYLAQYYPNKTVFQIGLDRLFAYENSKGREINNTELIGLICYNQAYFAAEQQNYAKAYNFVLLAQQFNSDSRSNREFEVNLYYKWGKSLFDQQKFYDAFEVFADAIYRYQDNSDFRKNCILACRQTLHQNLLNQDWTKTVQCIEEINELEILSEDDFDFQVSILNHWMVYFQRRNERQHIQRIQKMFERIEELKNQSK
ncbi:hypothetical protein JW964_02495 [candidate division KSB1 bacterium]|nr:hypothetical protein [candidate division KSB1 bacterium]